MTIADGLAVGLRAASFVAALQAAGLPIFLYLFGTRVEAHVVRIARLGTTTALVGLGLVLAAQLVSPARLTGSLAGVFDSDLQGLLMASDAGAATGLRALGLAVVALASSRRARLAALAGSTFVIVSFALMGHTVSAEPRWLVVVVLIAHLWLVAFWFGALGPLYIASRDDPPHLAGRAIESFSHLAVKLVPLLLVAGAILAFVLLPDWASLGTAYGRILVFKLTGFAMLMVLAALNKRRFGPRISRGDSRAVVAFRRTVAVEWLLIVAILIATGVMTSLFSPTQT